jgi:hypothetical protein
MVPDVTLNSMSCLMVLLPILQLAKKVGQMFLFLFTTTILVCRWTILLSRHIVVPTQMLKATRWPTHSTSHVSAESVRWTCHQAPHQLVYVTTMILALMTSSCPVARMCHENGRTTGFVFLLKGLARLLVATCQMAIHGSLTHPHRLTVLATVQQVSVETTETS